MANNKFIEYLYSKLPEKDRIFRLTKLLLGKKEP